MIYTDDWLTVYAGDCRAVLSTLEPESVHCVVTSPPYWGLRDYGTATWEGGEADCDHKPDIRPRSERPNVSGAGIGKGDYPGQAPKFRDVCGKCGATRIDNQLGLESTPEQYVENMVAVFREVKRVLRNDGTLWLNLGDSYASGEIGRHDAVTPTENGPTYRSLGAAQGTRQQRPLRSGLKPKDLVGIPWRVAFALQADGWYLRSDIIWAKPNPMPESVTDRPTKSHEYLFLLAKSERYYFDADAVREPPTDQSVEWNKYRHPRNGSAPQALHGSAKDEGRIQTDPAGRNIRSVWTVATQPYPGAHFATFPPKLVEPCIKAGTSERGVCPECGAPWRRVVDVKRPEGYMESYGDKDEDYLAHSGHRGGWEPRTLSAVFKTATGTTRETSGWQPSCAHNAETVPATVLDPFGGSGTAAFVAQSLSRRAILIDLNPDYIEQQLKRNAQTPLGLSA